MNKKKQIFESIHLHLMTDKIPSEHINQLFQAECCKAYPFSMLYAMKSTEQSPLHHPEGSVWNHTMLVVNEAAKRKNKSSNPPAFMWAALLHDIGKPPTTKKKRGKITSYNHDVVGAELARNFLSAFSQDTVFIESVCALVRYHMHILFVLKDLPFCDLQGLTQNISAQEIALLGLCDRVGRAHSDLTQEENEIQLFLEKLKGHRENSPL